MEVFDKTYLFPKSLGACLNRGSTVHSLHQRLCELVSRLPQVIHGILLCSERLKAIYTDRAEITEESMCERARE